MLQKESSVEIETRISSTRHRSLQCGSHVVRQGKRPRMDTGCSSDTFDSQRLERLLELYAIGGTTNRAIGGKQTLQTLGSGTVKLVLPGENGPVNCDLSEVLFVPKMRHKMLSFAQLTDAGWKIVANQNTFAMNKGTDIVRATRRGNLFRVQQLDNVLGAECSTAEAARLKVIRSGDTKLRKPSPVVIPSHPPCRKVGAIKSKKTDQAEATNRSGVEATHSEQTERQQQRPGSGQNPENTDGQEPVIPNSQAGITADDSSGSESEPKATPTGAKHGDTANEPAASGTQMQHRDRAKIQKPVRYGEDTISPDLYDQGLLKIAYNNTLDKKADPLTEVVNKQQFIALRSSINVVEIDKGTSSDQNAGKAPTNNDEDCSVGKEKRQRQVTEKTHTEDPKKRHEVTRVDKQRPKELSFLLSVLLAMLAIMALVSLCSADDPAYFRYTDCKRECKTQQRPCTIAYINEDYFVNVCQPTNQVCEERANELTVCLRVGQPPLGGSLQFWLAFKKRNYPPPTPNNKTGCLVWQFVSGILGTALMITGSTITIFLWPRRSYQQLPTGTQSTEGPYRTTTEDLEPVDLEAEQANSGLV